MRKFVSIAIVLVSVAIAWPGQGEDGRAIVTRGINAAGGNEKLQKLKAMTWKEKGTYYGMGQGLPYTGIYAIQFPMQFRMEIEGVFTMVVDNDKGWTQMGGETKDMDKDALKLQQHNQRAGWIASLVPLGDRAYTVKSVGEAKVGEQPANIVLVTRPEYPEVKLYFEKKSGLLVKSEFKTKSPEQGNKEVEQAQYFSDFKDIDGARYPHKTVIKQDGKVFVEAEMYEMKTVGKLDAKVFAKPANN